ncbi:mobilization protein, partial [Klebsiella pneumoniae]|nr:mobilization protein [Klebsiella pneumoniae]HBY0269334.1 mobilization protein [Klebsiella pneumoniae]
GLSRQVQSLSEQLRRLSTG